MAGDRAAATLFDGAALLKRAVNYTVGPLGLVTTTALGCPTPCREWDLRGLLGHMNDSLAALQEALDLCLVELDPDLSPVAGPPPGPFSSSIPYAGGACLARGPESRGGPDGLNPAAALVDALCERATRLLGALASTREMPVSIGGYPLPASVVTSAGAIDVAVHGWDVARACGAPRPIPEQLAEDILAISPLLVTRADRPARFAAPVCLPAGASASDRLVAYLGREPG